MRLGQDGFAYEMTDGAVSVHFEHTVAITKDGPEILTLTQDGPQKGHRFSV